MTPESTRNKARAKLLAARFRRRNPGKVPLRVIAIWPKRTKRKPSKKPSLTKVDRILLSSVWC